jgi:hypothetical protein
LCRSQSRSRLDSSLVSKNFWHRSTLTVLLKTSLSEEQLIHVRFTALAVKIILLVENDGPNCHSSVLSSSGGLMADIPDCKIC